MSQESSHGVIAFGYCNNAGNEGVNFIALKDKNLGKFYKLNPSSGDVSSMYTAAIHMRPFMWEDDGSIDWVGVETKIGK